MQTFWSQGPAGGIKPLEADLKGYTCFCFCFSLDSLLPAWYHVRSSHGELPPSWTDPIKAPGLPITVDCTL